MGCGCIELHYCRILLTLKKKLIPLFIFSILVSVLMFFSFQAFHNAAITYVQVPSHAMEPTLPYESKQEFYKVDSDELINLQIQQIVLYTTPGTDLIFIGRILARENDVVEIKSKPQEFSVFVNGDLLNEPYSDATQNRFEYSSGEITVDKNHYFIMPDVRNTLPPPLMQVSFENIVGVIKEY